MAIKERKGIKKQKRQGSFIREYNYEITIVVLIALGIFLLVEDLEIKHYMYLGLRWFLFSIGDIIKGIRDNVIFLLPARPTFGNGPILLQARVPYRTLFSFNKSSIKCKKYGLPSKL